jgi:hypothetical protein
VLASIGASYKRNAAHVDLSPRATVSQGAAPSPPLFAEMLAADLPHMLDVLSTAEHVRLILMAGAATGALYVKEFVARYAPRPYRLDGATTRHPVEERSCGTTLCSRRDACPCTSAAVHPAIDETPRCSPSAFSVTATDSRGSSTVSMVSDGFCSTLLDSCPQKPIGICCSAKVAWSGRAYDC